MKINKTLSVIGGDSRLIFAARYLHTKGFRITLFGNELGNSPDYINMADNLSDAFQNDIILLPLPYTKNNKTLNTPLSSREITLKDISDHVKENNTVFIGMGHQSFIKQLSAKTMNVIDYFTIEELTYKNALLTAEGILGIILEKLPISVKGMKIAVCGYGRIGSIFSEMAKSLGADVYVFARSEVQRVKAEIRGHKAYDIKDIGRYARVFDCFVNTVPSRVIGEDTVKNAGIESVFIEAASSPYGIDSDACNTYKKTLIKAFSLPGKTSPKTAGIIIGETVENCLKEVL